MPAALDEESVGVEELLSPSSAGSLCRLVALSTVGRAMAGRCFVTTARDSTGPCPTTSANASEAMPVGCSTLKSLRGAEQLQAAWLALQEAPTRYGH